MPSKVLKYFSFLAASGIMALLSPISRGRYCRASQANRMSPNSPVLFHLLFCAVS